MSSNRFFLPSSYRENRQASSEVNLAEGFWKAAKINETYQIPVYRLVAKIARETGAHTVLDVGSGTGTKLMRFVAPTVKCAVGVDQQSGVQLARQHFPRGTWIVGDFGADETWHKLAAINPDLVILADVIEHLDDPADTLSRIRRLLLRSQAHLIVSTPDRAYRQDEPPMGPPNNPRHVREWTEAEFRQLLKSVGLRVVRSWHQRPRSYRLRPREVARAAHRMLRRQHPLDRKYAMVFEVGPA